MKIVVTGGTGFIGKYLIAGLHDKYEILVESQNARGVVPIRTNNKSNRREVTREDIDKVIEIATAINYPVDREKIHVIPQNYLVDGVGVGVHNPVNR